MTNDLIMMQPLLLLLWITCCAISIALMFYPNQRNTKAYLEYAASKQVLCNTFRTLISNIQGVKATHKDDRSKNSSPKEKSTLFLL